MRATMTIPIAVLAVAGAVGAVGVTIGSASDDAPLEPIIVHAPADVPPVPRMTQSPGASVCAAARVPGPAESGSRLRPYHGPRRRSRPAARSDRDRPACPSAAGDDGDDDGDDWGDDDFDGDD